jgi:uncharacterized protein (TIGR02118 family)
MAAFVSMYSEPEDVEGFEAYFRDVHMPIVERYPTLESVEVLRGTGTPRGGEAPYHVMAVVRFASQDAMMESFRSEAGMESARDARAMTEKFGIQATLMVAEDF